MTNDEKIKTAAMFVKMAMLYNRPMTKEVAEMMAEPLAEYSFESVYQACIEWQKTESRFPLPADIRKKIEPETIEHQAQQIPYRINEAIGKFGSYNSKDAAAYLGPVAWDVVRKLGGWQHLCHNLGDRISFTTFVAQVRDLSISTLELDRKGLLDKQIDYRSGETRIGGGLTKLIESKE